MGDRQQTNRQTGEVPYLEQMLSAAESNAQEHT